MSISNSESRSLNLLINNNYKDQKIYRCIICGNIPLIFLYNLQIHLKCIYCKKENVICKRLIGHFCNRDLKTIAEISSNKNYYDNFYCQNHKEIINSFCENCKINLCLKCENEHKNHRVKSLHKYFLSQNDINNIQEKINKSKLFLENFEKLKLNDLDNNQIIIKIQKEIKKIFNFFSKIKNEEIFNKYINQYPKDYRLEEFPFKLHEYYLYIKNINLSNENDNKYFQNNETVNNIITHFKNWKNTFIDDKEEINGYIEINHYLIIFAQNILDVYKMNEQHLNYQICYNLKNIKDKLIEPKTFFCDKFELFIYFHEKFINRKYIKFLDLNLWKLKPYEFESNFINTSLKYNKSVEDIRICNWIYNSEIYSGKIFLYDR